MVYAQALSQMAQSPLPVSFVELRQSLPSRISIISPSVDQLMRFIARFRTSNGSEQDIELTMREALANAIIHGNRQDPDKYVYVVCRCTTDGEVSIAVQNEGQGFTVDSVADPATRETRLLSDGRWIYPMKTLMDEVLFEQSGTVVFVRKASDASQGQDIRKAKGGSRTATDDPWRLQAILGP